MKAPKKNDGQATPETQLLGAVVADLPTPEETLGVGGDKIAFIPSGCALLDCVVGGGWPIGRVCNIVGDKSTGKTLLAEEAMANFLRRYEHGRVWYRETEAAFDTSYAQALGLDIGKIDFGPKGTDTQWDTLESVMDDIDEILAQQENIVQEQAKELRKGNKKLSAAEAEAQAYKTVPPGLYILDSLDGISTETGLKRDIHKGSYNLDKPKLLGEMFSKTTRRLRRARVCVMIISQIRANIGAMIAAKKYVRSGGKSLDFYASVVVYLADLGKVYREIDKIKRPIAVHIKAKCDKNKISMPYRECEFDIRFAYGIEDDGASLDWLQSIDMLAEAGFEKMPNNLDDVDSGKLRKDVVRVWEVIENKFKPAKGKYA